MFLHLLFFKGSLKCECRADMRSHYWPATGNTFRKISTLSILPFNFLKIFFWMYFIYEYTVLGVFDLKQILLLIPCQAKLVYRKVLPPLRKRTLQAGRTVQVNIYIFFSLPFKGTVSRDGFGFYDMYG